MTRTDLLSLRLKMEVIISKVERRGVAPALTPSGDPDFINDRVRGRMVAAIAKQIEAFLVPSSRFRPAVAGGEPGEMEEVREASVFVLSLHQMEELVASVERGELLLKRDEDWRP